MAGTHGIDNVLNDIASAGAPAVAVLGAPRSGKTAAVLDLYRRYESTGGACVACAGPAGSKCLLIAPNAPAADYLRRRLLAESPTGTVLAPAVTTFASLAGKVLAAAGDSGRLLAPFHRHLLLRQIVDELRDGGKLTALTAVADTPGLVRSLDRTIAELKRSVVEPDDLRKAMGAKPSPKHADLWAIYSAYQDRLLRDNAYDTEGRVWQARVRLAQAVAAGGDLPGMEGVRAIVADGFTDFTPTQLQMLALLAGRLERVVVTLPWADDGRDRLWRWTKRTLDNLRKAMGSRLTELPMPPRSADPSGLAGLMECTFRFEAASCTAPAGLRLLAAGGPDAELNAIASAVKKLLLAGAAPGSIAVLARSLETYRPAVGRVFAEHDIPLAAAPMTLTDSPVVRFLLDVANMASAGPTSVGGLAFHDVLRVVKNSYFRPAALVYFNPASGQAGPRTVAAAEWLIRQGNVLAGRQAYADAADRLAHRADQADGDDDDAQSPPFRPAEITSASRMLACLFDLAEASDVRRPTAAGMRKLIDSLDLRAAVCVHDNAALIARDLRALAELDAALDELAEPLESVGELGAALSAVQCAPPRTESVVDVLDVLDARAVRYAHVFLLGVNEGAFPRAFSDGSLIGEAERETWTQHGADLDTRGDLTAREMLLFHLACSRADESLTVSWLDSDSAGRPGAPSSFAESLVAPLGGLASPAVKAITHKLPVGQFLPSAGELTSRRDATNLAVVGLTTPDTPGAAALAWLTKLPAGRHGQQANLLPLIAAGMIAADRRWRPSECDEFDGRLADADLLAGLAKRFGQQAIFSASQFDAFGACPWRFFAKYVLNVEPLREPQRRLEAVAAGIFCHEVLRRTFVQLAGNEAKPVRLGKVSEADLLAALDQAVGAAAAEVESRRIAYPALWAIQREQMHAMLRDYLLAGMQNDALETESLHYELAFGLDGWQTDQNAQLGPVEIATKCGPIRLHGRIDRVDRVTFGGRAGLFVVDYKTGACPKPSQIAAGLNVQIPLYSAAVEQLLGEAALGGAFHHLPDRREVLFAAIRKHGGRYMSNAGYPEAYKALLELVGEFVGAMRAGRFDALPAHGCPSYCQFRQVCQFSPARAECKTAPASKTPDAEVSA